MLEIHFIEGLFQMPIISPPCMCSNFSRRQFLATSIAGLAASQLSLGDAYAAGLKLRGQAKVDGATATEGTIVTANSTVEVAPGSEVAFAVKDDAFILRGEEGAGATVTFNGPTGAVQSANVPVGALLSVFSKGSGRTVVGSTATIGIRGTGFYMVSKSQSTYVCYCYGSFDFTANSAPQLRSETVSSYHDKAETISIGAKGPELRVVPKLMNHSDAELIAAEHSVGRKAPFER